MDVASGNKPSSMDHRVNGGMYRVLIKFDRVDYSDSHNNLCVSNWSVR